MVISLVYSRLEFGEAKNLPKASWKREEMNKKTSRKAKIQIQTTQQKHTRQQAYILWIVAPTQGETKPHPTISLWPWIAKQPKPRPTQDRPRWIKHLKYRKWVADWTWRFSWGWEIWGDVFGSRMRAQPKQQHFQPDLHPNWLHSRPAGLPIVPSCMKATTMSLGALLWCLGSALRICNCWVFLACVCCVMDVALLWPVLGCVEL